MIGRSSVLILVCLAAHAAHGGDAQPGQQGRPLIDNHCAVLGEGFFAVAGSNACIRISGRISAGAGFAEGGSSATAFGPRLAGASAGRFDVQTAASGDLRFDTEPGAARVYVRVTRDVNPRWAVEGQ